MMPALGRLSLLIIFLSIPAIVLGDGNKQCEWEGKTDPQALKGTGGNDKDEDYFFTHLSDADKEKSVYLYVYYVRNDHKEKLLPVTWEKANIAFTRLKSKGGCCRNDFESGFSPKEEKTTIEYGPTKNKKKDASLYFAMADDKERENAKSVPLKSRLYARLDSGDVNLEFVSRIDEEKKAFRYEVTNKGELDVRFSVVELDKIWEPLKPERLSKWDTSGGLNLLRKGEKPSVLAVKHENTAAREVQVAIRVFASVDDINPLVTGRVSVYVPANKK